MCDLAKEFLPIEEGKWVDIPACPHFKRTHFGTQHLEIGHQQQAEVPALPVFQTIFFLYIRSIQGHTGGVINRWDDHLDGEKSGESPFL